MYNIKSEFVNPKSHSAYLSHLIQTALYLLFIIGFAASPAYAQEDELVIFSCLEKDVINAKYEAQDLDIYVRELFELFTLGECVDGVSAERWESITVDCTTGELNLSNASNFSAIKDRFERLRNPYNDTHTIFQYYYRNVKALGRCEGQEVLQVIAIEQSSISSPSTEITLPCGENPDPAHLYEAWKAAPVTLAEYSAWIPNFDPTPMKLEGELEGFNFEGIKFTDASGDEVPYDPRAISCGYAIDWDDSDRVYIIAGSEASYKFFRSWTVYNWCNGHLELIDVIPQIIRVCMEPFPAVEDELVILSCQDKDAVALNYENQNVDTYARELYELFTLGECVDESTTDSWKVVHSDCTTEMLEPMDEADFSSIRERFEALIDPVRSTHTFFHYYYRNVKTRANCGGGKVLQVIAIEQSSIATAATEIILACRENPDPRYMYEKWKSDPVTNAKYGAFIPNFDPTPLELQSANFGMNFTDSSGDETPYDPTSYSCGYAFDWTDSETIPISGPAGSYKFFRDWTVYNWCSGQLELINIVPQIVKVCGIRNSITTGEEFAASEAIDITLYQNYPNPVQEKTTIAFSLPEAQIANLHIMDTNGKLVKSIQQHFSKGYNEVLVDTSAFPAGVFSYTLSSEQFSTTKMMLITH